MKSILIVDDSPDVAETTATLLALLGYRTRTAYNGRQAVDAVEAERPDVVLLDLTMPVLDGYGAAEEIRRQFPTPPPVLIALSALVNANSAGRLKASGFDDYLTKPAAITKLIAAIEGR